MYLSSRRKQLETPTTEGCPDPFLKAVLEAILKENFLGGKKEHVCASDVDTLYHIMKTTPNEEEEPRSPLLLKEYLPHP
jgi:hypothetical protein